MRLILINPITGEGFDWETPFKNITRSQGLSRFAKITATLPAIYNRHTDAAGHPWVLDGGTIAVVEENNGNLTSGLILKAPLKADLEIQATGLSTLATDTPWDTAPVEWVNKDALQAWRDIWEHIIARSGVKNFTITGDTRCGVTVGRGASRQYREVQADIARLKPDVERADRSIRVHTRNQEAAAQRMYRAGGSKRVGEMSTGTDGPVGTGMYYEAHIQVSEDDDRKAVRVHFWRMSRDAWAGLSDSSVLAAADEYLEQAYQLKVWEDRRRDPADAIQAREAWIKEHYEEGVPEPFELNAWSTRDLSAVLEELRELGGFDYVERTQWDGDELVFSLEVRNKVGIPKPDLRFELDVNIHAHPELARGDVRTEVHAHGAGEGKSTLMADRALSHPRLVRTVESVDDADWDTKQLVNKGADKALVEARKALEYTIHGLVVHDHPAAPLHAFTVGDSITVRGRHADGVRREFPVRITEITRVGDESKVSLEVDPV